jgi:hypothetical protein
MLFLYLLDAVLVQQGSMSSFSLRWVHVPLFLPNSFVLSTCIMLVAHLFYQLWYQMYLLSILPALVPSNPTLLIIFSAYPKVISLCLVLENVKLISEDPGFDPVEISPADSEERRIHEEEIAKKRLNENIHEEIQHGEKYAGVGNKDLTFQGLAETIVQVQNQLIRIESKIDTLIDYANREKT